MQWKLNRHSIEETFIGNQKLDYLLKKVSTVYVNVFSRIMYMCNEMFKFYSFIFNYVSFNFEDFCFFLELVFCSLVTYRHESTSWLFDISTFDDLRMGRVLAYRVICSFFFFFIFNLSQLIFLSKLLNYFWFVIILFF